MGPPLCSWSDEDQKVPEDLMKTRRTQEGEELWSRARSRVHRWEPRCHQGHQKVPEKPV